MNEIILQYNRIFFILLFFLSSCENTTQENLIPDPESINDYTKRTYDFYVPPAYSNDSAIPLVIAFHGSNGTGKGLRDFSNFDYYANSKKFIVIYPDSYNGIWGEDCGCTETDLIGVDDIGYVDYLIKKFSDEYNIDQSKIFAVGLSQGGLFLHNLACKRADKFAGFASLISTMSVPVSKICSPSKPVNMLMVNGTNDNQFLWEGFNGGLNSLVSIPGTFEYWSSAGGCQDSVYTEQLPDAGIENISLEKLTRKDCTNNTRIVLYKINGGVHTWYANNEIDFAKTVFDFFEEVIKFN